MAFTAALLGKGTVSNSQAALYTSTGVKTYVRHIGLFNTSATPQTVVIYIKSGGTSYELARYVFSQQYDHEPNVLDEPVLLSSGDSIEAVTTTAAVVKYTVS